MPTKKGTMLAVAVLLATFANAAKTIAPITPALVNGCYEISSAAELYGFASLLKGVDTPFTGCAKLTADIVVNEGVLTQDDSLNVADTANFVVWSPIYNFAGVFDGLGHTISGIYYDYKIKDGPWSVAGFFSTLVSGEERSIEVRNLGIVGSFFHGYQHVGAIVGSIHSGSVSSKSNVLIENCSSHVRLETDEFFDRVGGIVGYVDGRAVIRNCSASGLIVGSYDNVGGVVGEISIKNAALDDQPIFVENCSSNVRIKGIIEVAGGIVGRMNGWVKIINGENHGEVEGDTTGGIASLITKLMNCFILLNNEH